mgnify:CR=1 FL=1
MFLFPRVKSGYLPLQAASVAEQGVQDLLPGNATKEVRHRIALQHPADLLAFYGIGTENFLFLHRIFTDAMV